MKFREDGTFHILQFADIQELPEASEDTMALIRRALDTAGRIWWCSPVIS